MRIRLYLDEDAIFEALIKALASEGTDVTTVSSVQRRGYSDEQQLLYATEQGRVIYTFNTKHYAALHNNFLKRGLSHAGIIVVPTRAISIGEQMRRIVQLVEALTAEEMQNRLEYLSSWS